MGTLAPLGGKKEEELPRDRWAVFLLRFLHFLFQQAIRLEPAIAAGLPSQTVPSAAAVYPLGLNCISEYPLSI